MDCEKIIRYQIQWKSVQWGPSHTMQTCRQADRRDEANSRFLHFCQHA